MGLFSTTLVVLVVLGALTYLIWGPQQQGQPPPRPPRHDAYIYPPQPAPARPPRPVPAKPRVRQSQAIQSIEQYEAVRARAKSEGDSMAKAFEERRQARASRNSTRARELSDKGERHQAEMERLNKEASEWIFVENNKDSNPGEVDLHGLYVKEAEQFTERAIQEAMARGDSQVSLIVGKGLHSKDGSAKIKPAIEELVVRYNLVAEVDPSNAGVLHVSLDGRRRSAGRGVY